MSKGSRPTIHIDITLTDSCPTCGKHNYFPQPDGKRKCRSCGTVYEGKLRVK